MASFIALTCILLALGFPTFMLCITYPLNKKWALFWSNYITNRSSRIFFAILRLYRKFYFLGDKKSKENLPEQFVVISNHQSLIDIVVYLYYFLGHKVRFVAKDGLSSAPMVGKMLRSQQHCMIPRKGNMTHCMRELNKFGKRAASDNQILPVIFPEGTRSRDGNVGKFYSAGFRMLEETVNLPVVCCALDGGWKLADLKNIFSSLYKGTYRVKVLKVYDTPKSKSDYMAILDESKQLIENQLTYWRSLPEDSLEV